MQQSVKSPMTNDWPNQCSSIDYIIVFYFFFGRHDGWLESEVNLCYARLGCSWLLVSWKTRFAWGLPFFVWIPSFWFLSAVILLAYMSTTWLIYVSFVYSGLPLWLLQAGNIIHCWADGCPRTTSLVFLVYGFPFVGLGLSSWQWLLSIPSLQWFAIVYCLHCFTELSVYHCRILLNEYCQNNGYSCLKSFT